LIFDAWDFHDFHQAINFGEINILLDLMLESRRIQLGLDCKFLESILNGSNDKFSALKFKSETEYFS